MKRGNAACELTDSRIHREPALLRLSRRTSAPCVICEIKPQPARGGCGTVAPAAATTRGELVRDRVKTTEEPSWVAAAAATAQRA